MAGDGSGVGLVEGEALGDGSAVGLVEGEAVGSAVAVADGDGVGLVPGEGSGVGLPWPASVATIVTATAGVVPRLTDELATETETPGVEASVVLKKSPNEGLLLPDSAANEPVSRAPTPAPTLVYELRFPPCTARLIWKRTSSCGAVRDLCSRSGLVTPLSEGVERGAKLVILTSDTLTWAMWAQVSLKACCTGGVKSSGARGTWMPAVTRTNDDVGAELGSAEMGVPVGFGVGRVAGEREGEVLGDGMVVASGVGLAEACVVPATSVLLFEPESTIPRVMPQSARTSNATTASLFLLRCLARRAQIESRVPTFDTTVTFSVRSICTELWLREDWRLSPNDDDEVAVCSLIRENRVVVLVSSRVLLLRSSTMPFLTLLPSSLRVRMPLAKTSSDSRTRIPPLGSSALAGPGVLASSRESESEYMVGRTKNWPVRTWVE